MNNTLTSRFRKPVYGGNYWIFNCIITYSVTLNCKYLNLTANVTVDWSKIGHEMARGRYKLLKGRLSRSDARRKKKMREY